MEQLQRRLESYVVELHNSFSSKSLEASSLLIQSLSKCMSQSFDHGINLPTVDITFCVEPKMQEDLLY